MNYNLYQLSLALQNIQDELVESGGELTDALEKRLDESGLAFNEKVENIGKWCLNLGAQEDMLDKEIARLQGRKHAVKAHKDRLKAYVMNAMVAADKTKVELGTFAITVCKNPPSVEIENPSMIPARFIIIKTETTVDKKGILNALRLNEVVEGARLAPTKNNLRIK